MLERRMISFMKLTKDTHSNPVSDIVIDRAVKGAVDMYCTHAELATVLGRPNWAFESARWVNKFKANNLKVTWRCASDAMEGLYGVQKAVGANRKPPQFYIDLAVNSIKQNPDLFEDGHEWAIYPERTEGIFWPPDGSDSWIWPASPSAYGNFFVTLANASEQAFAQIGKKVKVCLQANNGSEFLSGWMGDAMPMLVKAGCLVVDHYEDGDVEKLKTSLRSMKAKYNLPVYLQESAPHRFSTPTTEMLTAYFKALDELIADGTLVGIGFWSGWTGTPESAFNSDWTLNALGIGISNFYKKYTTTPVPVPTPIPTPTPTPTPTPAPVDLKPVLDAIVELKSAITALKTLEQAEAIIYGAGTLSVRMAKLKELIPNS